jgi:hypothetical protein
MRKALGRLIEAQALVLRGQRPLLQKHTKHMCASLVGAVSDRESWCVLPVGAVSDRESLASACIAVRDRSYKTVIVFVGPALHRIDKRLAK